MNRSFNRRMRFSPLTGVLLSLSLIVGTVFYTGDLTVKAQLDDRSNRAVSERQAKPSFELESDTGSDEDKRDVPVTRGADTESSALLSDGSPLAKRFAQIRAKQALDAEGKLKPQMGWSSWNHFRYQIDEEKMLGVARAMKQTGLADAGFKYFNLDDNWHASVRDANGRLQFDAGTFPSGPDLVKQINALGMKMGLYSSAGALTCEDLPGSYDHELIDAQTFAEWGVEYLKYDYCHIVDLDTDFLGNRLSSFPGLSAMQKTPEILAIGLNSIGSTGQMERQYLASEAETANGASYSAINKSITGIRPGQPGGRATWTVEVPHDGRYMLSVTFLKKGPDTNRPRYAEVRVDGGEGHEIWFPPTSKWSRAGRTHVVLDLTAGTHQLTVYNPIIDQKADTIRRYARMAKALKQVEAQTGRPILFSISEHNRTEPYTWASRYATSWRISTDILPTWVSVVGIYDSTCKYWQYAKPGAYNDPDMLEVGVEQAGLIPLNEEQNRSHFALWAFNNAPLILSMDVRDFIRQDGSIDEAVHRGSLKVIKNPEIIAINQDNWMMQAKRIVNQPLGVDVLVKPLENGEVGVLFFNRGVVPLTKTLDLASLYQQDDRVTLFPADHYAVRDLYDEHPQDKIQSATLNSGTIPGHGVRAFRIRNVRMGELERQLQVRIVAQQDQSVYRADQPIEATLQVQNIGQEAFLGGRLSLKTEGFSKLKIAHQEPTDAATGPQEVAIQTLQRAESQRIPVVLYPEAFKSSKRTPALSAKLKWTISGNYESTTGEGDAGQKTGEWVISLATRPELTDERGIEQLPILHETYEYRAAIAQKNIEKGPLSLAGQTYDYGLGVNAHSELTYFLGGGNYRLVGFIGADDSVKQTPASLQMEIYGDEKRLYQSPLFYGGQSLPLDLTLGDIQTLRLVVTDGGNGNNSDRADWVLKLIDLGQNAEKVPVTVQIKGPGKVRVEPAETLYPGQQLSLVFKPDEGARLYRPTVNGRVIRPDASGRWQQIVGNEPIQVGAVFARSEDELAPLTLVEGPVLPKREVALGTSRKALNLPTQVEIVSEDESRNRLIESVPVTWDTQRYHPLINQDYEFKGTLKLPAGITNPKRLQAQIHVTVSAQSPARNLAPLAKAFAPHEALAAGKKAQDLNDGIYDDQTTGGTGVFALKKPLSKLIEQGQNWVMYQWDHPVKLERLVLSTYFADGQAPTEYVIEGSQDEQGDHWQTLAHPRDLHWEPSTANREQRTIQTALDKTLGLRRLRLKFLNSNERWTASCVITELEAWGDLQPLKLTPDFLSAEIKKAEQVDLTAYPAAAQTALKQAIAQAKQYLDHPDATSAEVWNAYQDLVQAQAGLSSAQPLNWEPLNTQLRAVDQLEAADYSPNDWANVQRLVKQAEGLENQTGVTQQAIDQLALALSQAINQLTPHKTSTTGTQTEGSDPETAATGTQTEGSDPETATTGTQTEGSDPETAATGTQTEGSDPETATTGTQTEGSDLETAARGTQTEGSDPETATTGTQTEGSDLETAATGTQTEDTNPATAPNGEDRRTTGSVGDPIEPLSASAHDGMSRPTEGDRQTDERTATLSVNGLARSIEGLHPTNQGERTPPVSHVQALESSPASTEQIESVLAQQRTQPQHPSKSEPSTKQAALHRLNWPLGLAIGLIIAISLIGGALYGYRMLAAKRQKGQHT